MHHEFAHILHQTKKYDPEFKKISDGSYIGSDWVNVSNITAYRAGFVSPYSMSATDEDFVEIFSIFITSSPEVWNDILAQAATTGADGREIINRKFNMISNYLTNVWKIDIYELRNIVQRRTGEINQLDLNQL
jgi:substrate import-associated zinc metallohydrolase lipoprotein